MRPRAGVGFLSQECQIAINEALISASERLGSDGEGRDGAKGYMISLALKHPKQFSRLLSLLLDIQTSEEHAQSDTQNTPEKTERTLTDEEIGAMPLEEKKARLKAMIAAPQVPSQWH